MLLKEPRRGNEQQIADPIYSDLQKSPNGCKIETLLLKNTNGEI